MKIVFCSLITVLFQTGCLKEKAPFTIRSESLSKDGSGSIQIEGFVEGSQKKPLVVYVIDKQGYRQKILSDWKGERFRVNVDYRHFLAYDELSKADYYHSMGKALPLLKEIGNFEKRVLRYARLEVMPSTWKPDTRVLPYGQRIISLRREDLMKNKIILKKIKMMLQPVGIAKIKVTDEAGHPLVGGAFMSFVTSILSFGDKKKLPLWHHETFRPVLTRTDKQGEAWLVPIYIKDLDFPHYQIMAYSDKFCSFVSEKFIFKHNQNNQQILSLVSCPSSNSFGLKVNIVPNNLGVNILTEEVFEGQEPKKILYLNDEGSKSLRVRVDFLTPYLRPYYMELIEGFDVEEFPRKKTLIDPFRSVIEVENIPVKFEYNNSANGRFILRFFSEMSDRDQSRSNQEAFLFIKKRIDPPKFSEYSKISTSNQYGYPYVVRGDEKAKFFIKTEDCRDHYQIAIREVGISDLSYANCHNGQAEFQVKDLFLISFHLKHSGVRSFQIYLVDPYKNISLETNEENQRLKIFFDFTPLTSLHLSLRREYSGEIFLEKMSTDTPDEKILRPTEVTQWNLRFFDVERCYRGVDSTDLQGLEVLNHQIGGFSVAAEEKLFNEKTPYTNCSKEQEDGQYQPLSYSLQEGDIVFPQTDEEAVFYIQVFDISGWKFDPIQLRIPACSTLDEHVQIYCWED